MWPRSLAIPDGLVTISPFSLCSVGAVVGLISNPASGVWGVANLALFVPFRISRSILVLNMFVFNGAVVNGNLDVGIFDYTGRRLVSSGSTAQAGLNQIQTLNIADTRIGPGLFYIGTSMDNNVGQIYRSTTSTVNSRVLGLAEMAAAFVLPAIAVYATMATWGGVYPVSGLTARGVV